MTTPDERIRQTAARVAERDAELLARLARGPEPEPVPECPDARCFNKPPCGALCWIWTPDVTR